MSRVARVVVPGMPHHITQRGTRRFVVFQDEADRIEYLKLFVDSCRQAQLRVLAYCLMTNHVHYIAIPDCAESIYRAFHRVHGTYSKRFNKKYGFVGHLWQARPYSCVLDEPHFWNAIRYVEQNPVRAGLVKEASDYPWSSAAAHCSGADDPLLEDARAFSPTISDWANWLADPLDTPTRGFIRECTMTGRPCGGEAFVKQMEDTTHRGLTPRKRGRKPKNRQAGGLLFTRPA